MQFRGRSRGTRGHRPLALLWAALILLTQAAGAWAAPDGVMALRGKGAEGHKPYQGGKIEFLDVSLADELVHFAGGSKLPLRLGIRYRVLETAPVLLNSRLGTEYWRLCQFGRDVVLSLHTREPIDLSRAGEAEAKVAEADLAPRDNDPLRKGMAGVVGHGYFLVDQANGEWLDVVDAPPFFDRADLARRLTFTLADLSKFSLAFTAVESTWTPGGPVRVKLIVTDADGERFPVLARSARIRAGDWDAPLVPEFGPLSEPTGWLAATLPAAKVPAEVQVEAGVSAMAPEGPRTLAVAGRFRAGTGRKTAAEMRVASSAPPMPRDGQGRPRETRALWVAPDDITTRAGIARVVAKARAAGLNVLVPDIFVRATFLARSPLFPLSDRVEAGLDPVAALIEAAHKEGIEVHPWFCVTYRDQAFRDRVPGAKMVDAQGKPIAVGADLHRPEYRDFIVNLMVGVARDYPVDGIHLDYIRTMEQCYCDQCRAEFQAKHGKPLAEATPAEWTTWQREAVGDIVHRTAAGVRAARPKAILSAAVFANTQGGAAQGQDPAGWARQGWVDVVIPMDYQMQSLSVRATERQFLDALDDDGKLATGLSLYMRVDERAVDRPADLVRDQIEVVRGLGIHGYCLFVSGNLSEEIVGTLKREVNREPAVPYFR